MTPTKAKDPAEAVTSAEAELAAKRVELEEAVAVGDVERVLRIRMFTEVEGPRAVTTAASMITRRFTASWIPR